MANIELVIEIPRNTYEHIRAEGGHGIFNPWMGDDNEIVTKAIFNGTPLPKGHGKIVDIGKIDEDRVEKDNPIIYLTINGEYIEAVSLDYLNDLPTIIEAEKEDEE